MRQLLLEYAAVDGQGLSERGHGRGSGLDGAGEVGHRSGVHPVVIERLLPEMPPTLKGIDFCYDRAAGILYATALSENQLDAFLVNFTKTTADPFYGRLCAPHSGLII